MYHNMFWSGMKVNYTHLRVFGYKVFMHVPKEQREKLDLKSIECIFFGYGDNKFGIQRIENSFEVRM